MAEYSKEKIMFQLARVLAHPIKSICYTKFPRHDSKEVKLHALPEARIFVCVSGAIHLRFHHDNGPEKDVFLQPGESLFGASGNVVFEMWDKPQEMMAIIFYENLTRVIYINHDGISPPPSPAPNPTLYYHISKPINSAGRQTVGALEHIARAAMPGSCLPGGEMLMQALLQNVNFELLHDDEGKNNANAFLWNEIYSYVIENFASPSMDRDSLSKRFHVHNAYISRLFREKLGITFKDFVMERRFKMAKELLADPLMRIDEITTACGFQYTSYFIRAFRYRYNMTPGEYRERL